MTLAYPPFFEKYLERLPDSPPAPRQVDTCLGRHDSVSDGGESAGW